MERGITTKNQRKSFMTKSRLIKNKRLHPLAVFKNTFSRGSLDSVRERKIFGRNPLKLGMKASSILAIAMIVIMMVSVFAWLSTGTQSKPNIVQPVVNDPTTAPSSTTNPTQKPNTVQESRPWNPISIITSIVAPTPKPPGLIESNPNVNGPVWKAVAANAWNYYQPDTGVDRKTGLPKGTLTYPYFTDWDLGVYIQAVIDANRTGLIGNDGAWGSTARLEKVMTFLETRELANSTTKVPYWFYGSNGAGYLTQSSVDIIDTGTLFVALNNLKTFDSKNFALRIDNFVYNKNNRTDYAVLVPAIQSSGGSTSIYAYYCISGFACFFPELATAPDTILNSMRNAGTVTTYNVSLPKADISCEPLLYSFFNLNANPKIVKLMNETYSAHEAKYNATDQYVAFSEGNSQSDFVWEWVVMSNGYTWKITNGQTYSDINPIIYSKVSLSFLALYNTTFARNMTIYLERILPDPTNGYSAGADYNANSNNANAVQSVDSNTNGLILSAARYALHA